MGGRGQRFVAIALGHLDQVCTRPRPFGCLVSTPNVNEFYYLQPLSVCLFVGHASVGGMAA